MMNNFQFEAIVKIVDAGAPALANELNNSLNDLVIERNNLFEENSNLRKELSECQEKLEEYEASLKEETCSCDNCEICDCEESCNEEV